ncbi:OmpA family protein [Sphingomonas sp. URHD0057]|uniref:OmpA family protein n=1 Tax=Sphingomonas sp. URHD0057 TaxID=1380389 RepID=UPI00055CA2D4|nr:OmpA family protein [Sphingomonas sp. URHD0057]
MQFRRLLSAAAIGCGLIAFASCSTAPPPAPILPRPAEFTPLGLGARYLAGDVIGGLKARSAKMRAAKIRPLGASAAAQYLASTESELRSQTAGIGLDVLRVGDSILIRIPAALTFDSGSSAVKPQFDATLKEIARTVRTRNQSFVDVFAHTDTSGTEAGNLALSQKRATAVATYLAGHGVAKARIASRGYGESAPLYNPDVTEGQKAANRRVEIRLVAYRS